MIPNFRAWLKKEKRIVETDDLLCIDYENEEIVTQKIYFESGLPVERDVDNYDFDEIELMQSTGLFDRNNKEIFEGDIITNGKDVMCMKRHNTLGFYVEQKGKVEFIADSAVLEEFEEDAKEIADILEIIGNIYENPEFVKDEEVDN